MARWLLKTEPSSYSWEQMENDCTIRWTGIGNNWALKFLRQCQPGDEAFFYHTGSDRCVRGIVTVESEPYPHWQADCDCGIEKDDRLAVVDVAHKVALRESVTLAQVKSQPEFAEFHLVKYGRLSVMPVSDEHWERVIEMGDGVA